MWDFPGAQFKIIARYDKASFVRLVGDMETNVVYRNLSRNMQKPIWVQVMITLSRLGCDGYGASIGTTAIHWGKRYGAVCKYTS